MESVKSASTYLYSGATHLTCNLTRLTKNIVSNPMGCMVTGISIVAKLPFATAEIVGTQWRNIMDPKNAKV